MVVVVFSEWDEGWTVLVNGQRLRFTDHLSAREALRSGLGHELTLEEMRLAKEMAALYANEINCRVTLAGARWTGEIGDEYRGFPEENDDISLATLIDWLPLAANRALPAPYTGQ